MLTDTHDAALEAAILANLATHAAAVGFPGDFRPLSVQFAQDGVVLGGLSGRTGRGWLYIEYLGLPMGHHGAGLGRQIMAMAEAEAIARGCVGAFLNTVEFQAPGFYQKLGYREFGRIGGVVPQTTRIWFRKDFT